MTVAKPIVTALILLCINYVYSVRYSGHFTRSVTLTRSIEIQSPVLNLYLRLLECESNQESASWRVYATGCLQNTSCVGIHTESPSSMCFLRTTSRNEPTQTRDLWLIKMDLDQFERQCKFNLFFTVYLKIIQKHYI